LLIANAISGLAQGMSMIAIPWFFAQEDSLKTFGIVYLITHFISIIWVPFSGSIIDKYDRKKIFLTINLVVGCIIALVSFYGYSNGGLSLAIVGFVFLITFLNYNIHYPCLYAFVQEITEKENYSRMTSLLEIIGQFTTILSGAGATLLLEGTKDGVLNFFGFPIELGWNISAWEIHEIFMLDASTYFVSLIIIFSIRYISLSERRKESGSLIQRLKTGVSYLKDNRPILWFGIFSYTVFVALLLEAFYLGVSYVSNHLQESGDIYANTKITYSLGAICSGLFIRFLFKRMNIPKSIILMTFLTGIVFITLSQTKSIYILFIMMMLVGLLNAGVRIARITYLFRVVPNDLFGRTGSALFIFNVMLRIIFLSLFTLNFFQESNNIIYTYLILGVMLLISGLMLIFHYKTFDLSLETN